MQRIEVAELFKQQYIVDFILNFLDVNSMLALRLASASLASIVADHQQHCMERLNDEARATLALLSPYLKHIISKRIYAKSDNEINLVFHLLQLPVDLRKAEYESETGCLLPEFDSDLMNDALTTCIAFRMIESLHETNAMDLTKKLYIGSSEHLLYLLEENLLDLNSLLACYNSGKYYGPHNPITSLSTDNAVAMFRQGLLTLEDAKYILDLKGLVTDAAFALIREGIINSRLIAAMCKQYDALFMDAFTNADAQILLKHKYVEFKHLDASKPEDVNAGLDSYVKLSNMTDSAIKIQRSWRAAALREKFCFFPQLAKKHLTAELQFQSRSKI
jgi:hypothetical protein